MEMLGDKSVEKNDNANERRKEKGRNEMDNFAKTHQKENGGFFKKGKELPKMNRKELLELLVAQSKENERLKARLEEAEQQLAQRRLMVAQAGSIAEASLQINQVFEAAQNAADQYIENIKMQQEELCRSMKENSIKDAKEIISSTKKHCQLLEEETAERCKEMLQDAERKAEQIINEAEGKAHQRMVERALLLDGSDLSKEGGKTS